MSAADAVREVARAALADRGLDIVDVTVTPAGRRRVVRILVDRSVAGLSPTDHSSRMPPIDLDEVTEATHALSAALDATEPLGEAPYVLEVSSPGVDRPLRTWAQLRRNVGRLVTVTTAAPQQVVGRLIALGPDLLTLSQADGRELSIPVAEVVSARVELEFTHDEDGPDGADLGSDADDLVGAAGLDDDLDPDDTDQ